MLIICKECGGQVSDKAAACPHCGCPVEKAPEHWMHWYDPEIMEGKTPEDQRSIDVAQEFYGDLLANDKGIVWNTGGQIVGEYRMKQAKS